MKIVEQFKSIQGEGKYLGIPSYFIRTLGCNLRCAWKNSNGRITKCDTPYTSWELERGEIFDVFDFINKNKKDYVKHVVITGGEPSLQSDLLDIVTELQRHHYKITIETNGTNFIPGIKNVFISISPKTATSYAATGKELEIHRRNNKFMEPLKCWMNSGNDYQIKFVYNNKLDLDEILRIQQVLSIPSDKIYIMAQGITIKQLDNKQQEIVNACVKYNFNYSPRLHINIWGNIRGV